MAVTQERDILSGDDTKVAGPQGLAISMLLCVVNTGLNGGAGGGGGKSQHPGLFLGREVSLVQRTYADRTSADERRLRVKTKHEATR